MMGDMRTTLLTDDPAVNPYRLLTALVVPRPIAWVSTVSSTGVGNLAPHSFFSVASATPPIVMFTSVGRKDTLRNVMDTGEFVVNLASLPQLAQVNNSSARFALDQDEATALGITMEPSERVRPSRVADSPASLECTLHTTWEVGDSVLVLGLVVAITVQDEVLVDGHPVFAKLQPLARLGREEWGLPGEAISVPRPARPEDIIT
jgi:flavin reductase (DIM6/NTAB) family NADH-FMN oxidoreductase RutF